MLGMSFFMASAGGAFGIMGVILGLMFLGIFLIPYLFLFRFSKHMNTALHQKDQNSLVQSFSNLKSHYKFLGIMMCIMIGFYLLGMIAVLATGGLAGLGAFG